MIYNLQKVLGDDAEVSALLDRFPDLVKLINVMYTWLANHISLMLTLSVDTNLLKII